MVILIDEKDNQIGQISKFEAHKNGLLHRAFSVLIFKSGGELLMQQRAFSKYHTPGLWSNTCCSHPKPGENIKDAARRRLVSEMGLDVELKFIFKIHYKSGLDNNMIEHEIDHVFIGYSDKLPIINKNEANDYLYMKPFEIEKEIINSPRKYTIWFKLILEKLNKEPKIFDFSS